VPFYIDSKPPLAVSRFARKIQKKSLDFNLSKDKAAATVCVEAIGVADDAAAGDEVVATREASKSAAAAKTVPMPASSSPPITTPAMKPKAPLYAPDLAADADLALSSSEEKASPPDVDSPTGFFADRAADAGKSSGAWVSLSDLSLGKTGRGSAHQHQRHDATAARHPSGRRRRSHQDGRTGDGVGDSGRSPGRPERRHSRGEHSRREEPALDPSKGPPKFDSSQFASVSIVANASRLRLTSEEMGVVQRTVVEETPVRPPVRQPDALLASPVMDAANGGTFDIDQLMREASRDSVHRGSVGSLEERLRNASRTNRPDNCLGLGAPRVDCIKLPPGKPMPDYYKY